MSLMCAARPGIRLSCVVRRPTSASIRVPLALAESGTWRTGSCGGNPRRVALPKALPHLTPAARVRLSQRDVQARASTGGSGNPPAPPSGGGGGGGKGDGGSGSGNDSSGLWGAYLKALEANPLMVKCLTSGVLNLAGDAISQLCFEQNGYDLKRALIFFVIGVGLVGPVLSVWYGTLGKLVTATGTTGAVTRLVLDQAVFAPAFVSLFFGTLLTLEGHPQDIPGKLKQDWWPAVQTNWKIWIPFQFLNFRYVPPQLQVAAANIIALAWNTYLSFTGTKAVEK
eukprot:CAMPEP_0118935612 /NCGR_PEP_ID=MMETSP1169-20130426/15739_1 /TAXON_ID=36882 /ORGANISM="Pyramimonas obovata, Strain CCMP722" /LENGTH=282 /DNA_ID=CAMNT_0006878669 /DNA_START=49 /DNA_END=897 /DNA_ORIENTATION=+